MNVVVVGAWTRSEAVDYDLVHKLLDSLKERYPSLLIITTGCDRGIGKIVKNKCMPAAKGGPTNFDFMEIACRIYGELGKMRKAQLWTARNAMLLEAGEEFHLLMGRGGSGASQMDDLLRRVQEAGRPYSTYQVDEKTGPKLISY